MKTMLISAALFFIPIILIVLAISLLRTPTIWEGRVVELRHNPSHVERDQNVILFNNGIPVFIPMRGEYVPESYSFIVQTTSYHGKIIQNEIPCGSDYYGYKVGDNWKRTAR